MGELLTVPNWSFGRNKLLLQRFEAIISEAGLRLHFLRSDIDHNRTVSAFSGEAERLVPALLAMAADALDCIDLNHHLGVHPRIGALDVCPFIPIDESGGYEEADAVAKEFAAKLSDQYEIPVFLYEKSATTGKETRLPEIRKYGFGGLLAREIDPDFGPKKVHPIWGATVVGARSFLIAFNVDLDENSGFFAKQIAQNIRQLRMEGDRRFRGVRSLGFPLASRQRSQVSFNVTLPNDVAIDPITEFVRERAEIYGTPFLNTELIGVIRRRDLAGAKTLFPAKAQIVEPSYVNLEEQKCFNT